jgi:hypothetical protein
MRETEGDYRKRKRPKRTVDGHRVSLRDELRTPRDILWMLMDVDASGPRVMNLK